MNELAKPLLVAERYDVDIVPDRICSMGNAGGFSGSTFWKVTTDETSYCLRRWPAEYPSATRLKMIHAVLRHVGAAGLEEIPTPVLNRDGQTITESDGVLWELTEWLPGRADFHRQPTARRIENIMHAVATFHRYAASVPTTEATGGPSLGLQQRLRQLRELKHLGPFSLHSPAPEALLEVQQHAIRWQQILQRVGDAIERELRDATQIRLELQPCIRDLWHDHVLLEDDKVTGIVDFGAMRQETVAGDLARLLGSLFEDDFLAWRQAIEHYETIRPLTAAERDAMGTFDRSAVLLSPYNWFRWLLTERRQFDRMNVVLDRIRLQMRRLERLAGGMLTGHL